MNPLADRGKSSPYTLPLRSNEIRLFRIFKYGDGSISGELRHFHLERSPKFIATSYVWGDRDDRVPIQLNGHRVDILKTALEFFNEMLAPDHFDQFPPSRTWWWMDCICINQDDPAERSVQVGLMSEIYQRALKTVIWLGEESEDSNVGMGFLKLLAEDWGVHVRRDDTRTYWTTNIWPHIGKNPEGWRAVESLLTRKWWERVWTLQEFLLSRDAAFFCGSKRISLDQMAYAIHAVWEWHQRHNQGIISRRGYEKGWNRIRMLEWYNYVFAEKEHLPLVAILTYTATSSVTDPRDRLYSLLGLISPFELDIISRPDYESSASSIYIDFAISFIKKHRNLDLLCIAPEMKENLPAGEAEKELDLPSWVPDWSLRRTQSPPMLTMANQSANAHIGNFRPLHSLKYYREYRASRSKRARVSFSADSRVIWCAGIVLDEIDGLGGGKAAAGGGGEDELSAEEVYRTDMVQSTSAVNTQRRSPLDVRSSSYSSSYSDSEHHSRDNVAGISSAILLTEQIACSLTLDRQDPYLGQAAPARKFAQEFRRICRRPEGAGINLGSARLAPETDTPDSTAEITEWFHINKDLRIRGLTLEEVVSFRVRASSDVDRRRRRRRRRRSPAGSGHHRDDHDPDSDAETNRDLHDSQDQRHVTRFATRFRSTTYRRGKRLIVTKTGIVGMAPRLARKGDVVCVLLGCSIPLVLRAEGGDESAAGGGRTRRDKIERRFTVIGEAYVDGYMNGEAVDEVDRGLRRVEDLKIV